MQAQVNREWVTYRQAEEIAGLSRTTLRKLVDEGEIKDGKTLVALLWMRTQMGDFRF